MENRENEKLSNGLKKLITTEFVILLCGTLFAWTNFTIETINYLNQKPCTTGCSSNFLASAPTNNLVNPLYTPCFYGAIFFTIAFVISILILKKFKKHPTHKASDV